MLMRGVVNVVLIVATSHPVMVKSGVVCVVGVDTVVCSSVVVILIAAHLHAAVQGQRSQRLQVHCLVFC